jgi:sec-independent protein translocase protein TatC
MGEVPGVVITVPRRRSKDPEGRMPLRAHLAELRTRLLKCGIAILLGAVFGWFLYDPIFEELQKPLVEIAVERHINANINFTDIASAFNLQLKISVYLGLILASPIWLYQLWAFVMPGLTKRERRYGLAFVAAGVPLFLGGIALGWLIIPNAVQFFVGFAPEGTSILPSADIYLLFVTRLLLVFGIAFLLPLFLVALNLVGVLSSKRLGDSWRVAIFLIFLFAAIASPSPDVGSMLALAFPMVALYLVAWLITVAVDRKRARNRRESGWDDLPDDVASPLEVGDPSGTDDLGPEATPTSSAIEPASRLEPDSDDLGPT